jgi:hypothetical protein
MNDWKVDPYVKPERDAMVIEVGWGSIISVFSA